MEEGKVPQTQQMYENMDFERAKRMLKEGGFTCVLCHKDAIFTSRERGVKPLLSLLEDKKELTGFSAADKVIGRAAAFLYVLLRIEKVYVQVISKKAVEVFKHYGIAYEADITVEAIKNRANTGYCPMEEAVSGIEEAGEALPAIKEKLHELQKNRLSAGV